MLILSCVYLQMMVIMINLLFFNGFWTCCDTEDDNNPESLSLSSLLGLKTFRLGKASKSHFLDVMHVQTGDE